MPLEVIAGLDIHVAGQHFDSGMWRLESTPISQIKYVSVDKVDMGLEEG